MASEFALSFLSQLLSLSYKRVTCFLFCYLKDKLPKQDIESLLESEATLTDILQRVEAQDNDSTLLAKSEPVSTDTASGPNVTKCHTDTSNKTKEQSTSEIHTRKKKSNLKVIDRRRRRDQRLPSSGSSSEEEEELCGRQSSDSSLSMLSDDHSEEDIQVLDSLTDSSASEEERTITSLLPQTDMATSAKLSTGSPPKPRPSGRRPIVLAASFNLAPAKDSASDDFKERTAESSSMASEAVDGGDHLLKEVYCETVYQSVIHTACSILAEDSYLIPIKVFTEWLQSYSIVIATCGQVLCMCFLSLILVLSLL